MLSLSGRSALVTGGSRGIGRAVCVLFGRLGARVVVNYRSDQRAAEETVESVRAAGGEATAWKADVGIHEEARSLVQGAASHFGGLDILVVSHGIWKRAPIDTMTPEQWDETVRTNLTGTYSVCHHAARVMIPRRAGAMILIASTSGQRGEPEYAHYSATKAAMISLTWSLAGELAPHGIRVNGVAPGWVLTDMTREILQGPMGAAATAPIPLGRAGTPEEIAGPVAFLASDLASYVQGEVLCVNGGAVMVD